MGNDLAMLAGAFLNGRERARAEYQREREYVERTVGAMHQEASLAAQHSNTRYQLGQSGQLMDMAGLREALMQQRGVLRYQPPGAGAPAYRVQCLYCRGMRSHFAFTCEGCGAPLREA